MEWLSKIRDAFVVRYERVESRASPTQMRKIDALRERIRKDWPDREMPPIFIITNVPRFFSSLSDTLPSPFYVPTRHEGLRRGVYFSQDVFNRLTEDEVVVVAAHEFGHHYLRTTERLNGIKGKELRVEAQKSFECEADQFAGYYVEHTSELMATSFDKIRDVAKGGPRPSPSNRHKKDSHPFDQARFDMLKMREVISLPPGYISFDANCHANLTTLEKSPTTIAPYSRLESFSGHPLRPDGGWRTTTQRQ